MYISPQKPPNLGDTPVGSTEGNSVKLSSTNPPVYKLIRLTNKDELKSKVGDLEKAFKGAVKVSGFPKYCKIARLPWLNENLSSLRKLIRKILNSCYRHRKWKP